MVECVHVLNGSKTASLGDRIVCVVQRVRLQTAQQENRKTVTSTIPKVNRGDVRRAIIVRTKQQVQRQDGSIVRFDDNACVLIDDKGEPIGSRIMGRILHLVFSSMFHQEESHWHVLLLCNATLGLVFLCFDLPCLMRFWGLKCMANVLGLVAKELKDKAHANKIMSLAPKVV